MSSSLRSVPAIVAGLPSQCAGCFGAQSGLPSKCWAMSGVSNVAVPVSSEFLTFNAPLVKMPSTKAICSPFGDQAQL